MHVINKFDPILSQFNPVHNRTVYFSYKPTCHSVYSWKPTNTPIIHSVYYVW
jgi:hypothetical protein